MSLEVARSVEGGLGSMRIPAFFPQKLKKAIGRTKKFIFDLESESTTDKAEDAKNPRTARPVILAISSGSYAEAFPWSEEVEELLVFLLRQPDLTAIAHNVLYDFILLHASGVIDVYDVKAKIRDTMILAFLLDENQDKGLKTLAKKYLRYQMKTYQETTAKNPKHLEIRACVDEIKSWERAIEKFPRERPWPRFDSDKKAKLSDLRKRLKDEADLRWPTTPTITKTGKTVNRRSREDREARSAWLDPKMEIVESKFDVVPELAYQTYVYENKITPLLEKIEDLKRAIAQDEIDYAKDDAWQTNRLAKRLYARLEKLPPEFMRWLDVENRVRVATLKMSCNGIYVDKELAQKKLDHIDPLIDELYHDVVDMSRGWTTENGDTLNPGSGDQLRKVLFQHLKIPIPVGQINQGVPWPKLTKSGMDYCRNNGIVLDLNHLETFPQIVMDKFIATDTEVLERLDHPIGSAILSYRTVAKLKSTYLQGLVDPNRERATSSFGSVSTKTGRLASQKDNLQNIPSRKKPRIYDERVQALGPELRACYVAPPGKSMIVADQSQIELRIITQYTKDKRLRKIYEDSVEVDGVTHYVGDLHADTSRRLEVPRKDAKAISFGLSYEMRAPRFARMNRMFNEDGTYDIATAAEWRAAFFRVNAGLTRYLDILTNCWREKKTDYKMLTGRLRRFPEDSYVTGGKILNSKVQGSSADLLKLAMVALSEYAEPVIPGFRMIFQVHDELGFEVDEKYAMVGGILVKYAMEYDWIGKLTVPILASAKVCHSWAAKDDDNLPEIGVMYARVAGKDMTFTADTWDKFVEYDNEKKIELKGASAMLTPEQKAFGDEFFPSSWNLLSNEPMPKPERKSIENLKSLVESAVRSFS